MEPLTANWIDPGIRVMALSSEAIIKLILGCLTLAGSIGGYVISVEKRLNGRVALQRDITEIKSELKDLTKNVTQISVTMARLDQKIQDTRGE